MSDVAVPDASVVPEACDMNLGPRQRHQRLMSGFVMGAVAIVAAVLLLALDAPRLWRLALFAPIVVSALGFIQYRAKT